MPKDKEGSVLNKSKWLRRFAEITKMVECGEYDIVSLNSKPSTIEGRKAITYEIVLRPTEARFDNKGVEELR